MMWTEETIKDMEFINKDIIHDKTLNPGLRADALRLEILKTYGGIYIDIDMALVQPLHSFFTQFDTDYFICVSHTKAFEVNNAIIGCTPEHPLTDYLIS